MIAKSLLVISAVLSMLGGTHAQTAPSASVITAEERTAANDAYQKQDWKTAAAAYDKIVKAEEKNPGARYRLGMAQLGLGQNADALKSFEAALAITPNSVFALAAAKTHARLGAKEKAYEILEKSLTMGGISPDTLNSDADLAVLRAETRFVDLVKRSDLAINPCKAKPEYRQFDFWIGEWLPKNAQGLTVGTSSIQLILGSCVILENWNTPVSSGKSFSNYDTKGGKWHQTWVDDKGTLTYYTGGMVGDKMVLDSIRDVSGKKTIGRMTFSKLANGDVRQHGETSQDDGKTWTTTFDFTYVRNK